MYNPLVSVVIPTFNRRDRVRSAVESAIDQSYKNIEIIVVDDGSTDGTSELFSQSFDRRVRYVFQENSGGSAARNKGIAVAQGEYVSFLDSDDMYHKDHLQNAMNVLKSKPTNYVFYSQVIALRDNGSRLIKPPRGVRTGEDISEYLMCDRGFVQTSTIVLHHLLAKKVGFKLGLRFGQDTDFSVRLNAAGAKFVMGDRASVDWFDGADAGRVSFARKGALVQDWLKSIQPLITLKAYRGYRGWHIAKGIFPKQPARAALYYLQAVFSGCYSPSLAIRIALQIFSPSSLYSRTANIIIKYGSHRNS